VADELELGPDRVELMAELTRLAFEASQLATPLDEAQFNWQPDGGQGWSVGQCLDHLTRANRCYLDALEDACHAARAMGERPSPPLEPGRLGRWFLGMLEPPVKLRVKAPQKIVPAPRCPRQATLVAFAGEQQRAIELVRASAIIDCNSVRFRNPLAYGLRTFNVATGLLVIPAHERRHLAQAKSVIARPDFPQSD
jgi:hypothetical protein